MCPQHSTRLPKASKNRPQKSPVSDEDVIQRRLKSQRRRTWQRKTEADDSVVDTDERRQRDLIDIIDCTHDDENVTMEQTVEINDTGLTESDEDCISVCSSIASGPSLLHHATPKKPKPSQGLCSACRKIYQKAKRTKAPIKNKLLDIDPESLTCDQWVLIKRWTPRRLTNVRGDFLSHAQLDKEVGVREGTSSACSRPHTFLQRNLRLCVRVTKKNQKKRTGRKRRRNGSQGSRAAKQQRLHSNHHRRHTGLTSLDEDLRSEGRRHQETNNQSNTDMPVDLTPCSVILENIRPTEKRPKQKKTNAAGRFRDLLAQLHSNSSMIVRETR
ncbi:uncharacterized protein LOC103362218 isoform X2 [Stegastes partitus]|nr:PREDICTED: uncharacterized protein LOC103362218 isoform X2 [Stegastes partitus]XP_008286735.1 PREDICTED: uncharacterized protein LOC103362218 isoform X2 [Stegastes partitus]